MHIIIILHTSRCSIEHNYVRAISHIYKGKKRETASKINLHFQKLDPLTSLSKASAQWEKRIHKSLNSMCSDLETSLAKIRPQTENEELSEKWNELSTYSLGNY